MPSEFTLGENSRKEVAEGLSHVLADTYTLYVKTQNYHWNVEGPRFRALHLMFEEQYTDLQGAVDELAERIRALGEYAPGSFSRFAELSSIKEADGKPPSAEAMVAQLLADNVAVGKDIKKVIGTAEEAGDTVTADMLTARLTVHDKSAWMLRAINK
jgi:starvation-inducible DNA-binding protein